MLTLLPFVFRAQSANWNTDAKCWDVELLQKPKGGAQKPITIHANYMMIAAGIQSVPKIPKLEVSIE